MLVMHALYALWVTHFSTTENSQIFEAVDMVKAYFACVALLLYAGYSAIASNAGFPAEFWLFAMLAASYAFIPSRT